MGRMVWSLALVSSHLYNTILALVDGYDYIEFNSGYENAFERTAMDIAKNIL